MGYLIQEIERLEKERQRLEKEIRRLKTEVAGVAKRKDAEYLKKLEEQENYIDMLEAHVKKYKKLERERHQHMFDVDELKTPSVMRE